MIPSNKTDHAPKTAVEFRAVYKRFAGAGADAVSDVSFKIREGEIVTILGTSGCGKTTLLKLVNRIYEPDQGFILFYGQPTKDMNPVDLRRKIGYVIQQVGLFPHMTIEENISIVPKILGWEKDRIKNRITELLTLVELPADGFRRRYPHHLSGGQQQRVGLARALAADPDVMLLDEPFGAIDAITRRNLQDELLKIHSKFQKTFIFVTHDIFEAFRLADRVIIMDKGRVQQFAAPAEIRQKPANAFVEQLVYSAQRQQHEWLSAGDVGGFA